MASEPCYVHTIRVAVSLEEKLQAAAKQHGMSLNKFILYCIEHTINHEIQNEEISL